MYIIFNYVLLPLKHKCTFLAYRYLCINTTYCNNYTYYYYNLVVCGAISNSYTYLCIS